MKCVCAKMWQETHSLVNISTIYTAVTGECFISKWGIRAPSDLNSEGIHQTELAVARLKQNNFPSVSDSEKEM